MKQSDVVDRVLSVSAIVAAIAAVVVAVYEARLEREHQRVSVWPYVTQFNSWNGGKYTRNVANVGLGPALVRSFEVRVDGKPQQRWRDVIRTLTDTSIPSAVYTSFGRGTVLLPGTTVPLLDLGSDERARKFHGLIDRMSTRVCYCSMYSECWLSDSGAGEPVRVGACGGTPDQFSY